MIRAKKIHRIFTKRNKKRIFIKTEMYFNLVQKVRADKISKIITSITNKVSLIVTIREINLNKDNTKLTIYTQVVSYQRINLNLILLYYN